MWNLGIERKDKDEGQTFCLFERQQVNKLRWRGGGLEIFTKFALKLKKGEESRKNHHIIHEKRQIPSNHSPITKSNWPNYRLKPNAPQKVRSTLITPNFIPITLKLNLPKKSLVNTFQGSPICNKTTNDFLYSLLIDLKCFQIEFFSKIFNRVRNPCEKVFIGEPWTWKIIEKIDWMMVVKVSIGYYDKGSSITYGP